MADMKLKNVIFIRAKLHTVLLYFKFNAYFCLTENNTTTINYYTMPRIINPDLCVSCGSCAEVCPVGAITAGDAAYQINPDECIDCGACEGTCPNGAISEA